MPAAFCWWAIKMKKNELDIKYKKKKHTKTNKNGLGSE